MKSSVSDRLSFAIFVCSCVVLAFAYGAAVGKFKMFPYTFIESAHEQLYASVFNPPSHLMPIRHEQQGAATHIESAPGPGVTLLTSFWPDNGWKPGIRLVDRDGSVLHRWDVLPASIWPEDPHDDSQAGTFNNDRNYVHGTWLFENGDVLFNVEYQGLARMSAQGEILWRLDRRTHHSIAPADDGNFWVSAMEWVSAEDPRNKLFRATRSDFTEDKALKVSPDGEILQEISLLQPLFEQGYGRLLWKYSRAEGMSTHGNDVEPLPASMADAYPLFEAGDLVVSLRDIHTVYVMDPDTLRIKWLVHDELNMQHDPDFVGGGWIEVFDNNDDGTDSGEHGAQTRVIRFRPHTGEHQVVYPRPESGHFYTKAGGKKQRLSNGNLLITEAQAARVFEVDPEGTTVWQWTQQHYDDKLVPEVLEGTRYEWLTRERVAAWN